MSTVAVLLCTLAHALLWWGVSLRTGRNDVADVWWWIGFIVVSMALLWTSGASPALILAAGCVTLWWGRLAWHIWTKVFSRTSLEDRRYSDMRKKWWPRAWITSLFLVFLLQGLCMLPVLSPLFIIAAGRPQDIWAFQVLGLGIFLVWFAIETLADAQMRAFRKARETGNRFLSTWLWRYSRHPNYFWESVVWCGISVMTVWYDFWYVSILSPVFITFLLLRVSGLPLSEARRRQDPEYREYARRTSGFLPWLPREATEAKKKLP